MSYAKVTRIDQADIPVIDLAPLHTGAPGQIEVLAAALDAAARGSGFFYVRNHAVPQALIDSVLGIAREFFALPLEQKLGVQIDSGHRGFIRVGEASMYDGARPDLKESFVWGREIDATDPDWRARRPLVHPNNWPAFMPGMRPVLMQWFDALQAVGERLLRAFAVGLGAPQDYFVRRMDRPVTRGSLIYYPPQPPQLGEQQFGVAPHTDYGCLTLLYQDDTGGLQVRARSGEWLTAHPIAGTFVVNVGDLLARWSNDHFVSTPHRVVNASGRARFSSAVFVDPNWDTRIEPVTVRGDPPHYEPVGCAEYILRRYDASFAYRERHGPGGAEPR